MFKADTAITIRRAAAAADGERAAIDIPTTALRCELDLRGPGSVRPATASGTIFLIPPPELPVPGDTIVCAGRSYAVRSVRICRDLDGRVVAARCTAE